MWGVFWGLWALSWYWSCDKGEAEFDAVGKLSFLLMPILVGAGSGIDREWLANVVLSFVAGICTVGIYCLNQANDQWLEDGHLHHFLYHDLTNGLDANAIYMSWYVIVALAALLVFPWRESGKRWVIWWRWPIVLFCFCFLMLLASRLLIIVFLFLVIPAYGLRYFRHTKRSIVLPIIVVVTVLVLLDALLRTNNPIHKRFSDVAHSDIRIVMRDSFCNERPDFTNLTLRLFVWRIAIENMGVRHLWLKGTGNGDVHYIQNDQIRLHGVPDMHEADPRSELYNVNLHNMYLQTLVTLGLPGLILFLMIAFGPLYFLHRSEGGYFFGLFHLVSILFMMQESALQTQAGVIFYSFFSALFWQGVKRRSSSSESAVLKG